MMASSTATRPLLLPLVPLYRLGLALRERKFQPGSPSIRHLSWPVVSVGNLSAGGSGKTPLTIALAKALAARGMRVDVLSRGYKRHGKAPARVDPNGSAAEFGDEPLVIAREAGVPVYVAAERYQAGLLAEAEKTKDPGTKGPREQEGSGTRERGSEGAREQGSKAGRELFGVHLLDDGFQHRQLHRAVDILILDRRNLEDQLLPAGNLRESIVAIRRATVLAIPADDRQLERFLREFAPLEIRWTGPIWRLRRHMEIPACDGPVAAFCGIARPEQFFDGIERRGVKLAARFAFPDHHRYSARDLKRIATRARQAGAGMLLTTEKDAVRLGGPASPLPIQTVGLRIEIEDQAAAIDWLICSRKETVR